MKKFGFATIAATAFAAALVGLAGPAEATPSPRRLRSVLRPASTITSGSTTSSSR